MRWARDVTTEPAHDIRASSLHQRLTVALAAAGERSRLAEVLQGALSDRSAQASALLRWDDVLQAAQELAARRADDRAALQARLDADAARAAHGCETADSHLEGLVRRRDALLDGARWAGRLHDEVAERRSAVEAAGQALDARRHDLRGAQAALERVLEQRAAAAAAVEEADRELGEMTSVGMDEPGLRRELEAAGRAVADAQHAHAAAEAVLEALEAQQPAAVPPPGGEVADHRIEAVLDAFEELRDAIIGAAPDREAQAVADAWSDLMEDLSHVVASDHRRPDASQLRAAEARLASASRALKQLDGTAAATLSDEERDEIEAAHAAVLAAQERLGRRLGAAAARQKLEAARTAERALLDRHRFGGYLDVVLSGGRVGTDDPTRAEIEREYLAAGAHLQALQAALQGPPELAHLESERARLLAHATDLLGVDPGDAIVELLRTHPQVPHVLVVALRDALAAVDVRPVATSLLAAAESWLRDQHERTAEAGDQPRQDEVASARRDVAEAAEALELAQRSVVALEAELTMRTGEDAKRLKRLAAAEQLRAQVDAVEATLTRAEDAARSALRAAQEAQAAAEVALDRAGQDLADLGRRVRALSDELPIDLRVEGDPLDSLEVLAARLGDHAGVLQPEIDAAEAAVSDAGRQLEEALAALHLAGTGGEGPQREDFLEGFTRLLADDGATTALVLDEPLSGLDEHALDEMLELIRTGSATRPVVLLTEDPQILGWAIELPADVGAAVPADALLARARPVHHDLTAGGLSADGGEASTTSSARRWAGQR